MNNWVRQTHRWLSIVFTLTVIANFVAMAWTGRAAARLVTYSPLLPLALLMFTGLYMFALPYATRWRSGSATSASRIMEDERTKRSWGIGARRPGSHPGADRGGRPRDDRGAEMEEAVESDDGGPGLVARRDRLHR